MMIQEKLTGYPSIDTPWLKYYSEEAVRAEIPAKSLYRNILDHNENNKNGIALQYFHAKISYQTLFGRVEECAKALLAAGINCGDCFVVCSPGIPETVALILAASKIGAVANMLNPTFQTEQMIDRINETDAKLLFVMDKMYSFVREAIDKTCIEMVVIIPAAASLSAPMRFLSAMKTNKLLKDTIHGNDKYNLWSDFLRIGKEHIGETEADYAKDRPVVMVYSSGTTGASKGILLTNDGMNASIIQYETAPFQYQEGNSFLHLIPVWFSTGMVISLFMPMCLGISTILIPSCNADSFKKALLKYRPNYALAVGGLWISVIDDPAMGKLDLSNMIYPITGGEYILPKAEKALNDFFAAHGCKNPLVKGYGMCELGATATTSFDGMDCAGAVGAPLPKVTVSVFDTETEMELQYGQRGELRIDTPCRMKEYFHNPDATAAFFRQDSIGRTWGCTGDIGYVDENGYVYILGRATDFYMAPDGNKYYLFDTKNVILQNIHVKFCEVVPMAIHGVNRLVAHVVLESDIQPDEYQNVINKIQELCSLDLPMYAVPYAYKIRESFPTSANSNKKDISALAQDFSDWIVAGSSDNDRNLFA
jgi:long-chain acyl-CoA synthetase